MTRRRWLSNQLLAGVAAMLLACVLVALWKAQGAWIRLPAAVLVHLAGMLLVLALTPLMLLARKGTAQHRLLGRLWALLMFGAAVHSLFFATEHPGPGHFGVFTGDVSPIHALSLFVALMVPRAVWLARHHHIARHETAIRGLVIGALGVAGLFTFLPGRTLGRWFLG
jgi:uncharacterized membrane protein